METRVHILVTVRKPEMLKAALLVFKTLRVGFPTAYVYIWGNHLNAHDALVFQDVAKSFGGSFQNISKHYHDEWVEELILGQSDSFWICDTDVVFFKPIEYEIFTTAFAGRHQPEYNEPWTNTVNCERLHTCVAWYNPSQIRGEMMKWSREFIPLELERTTIPWIRQNIIPHKGLLYLYDTTAGLFNTCSHTSFSPEQDSSFEHLHAGTYADAVSKCPALKDLYNTHKQIYENVSLARGLKQVQDKFYQEHSTSK